MKKYLLPISSLIFILLLAGVGCKDTEFSTNTTSTLDSRLELPNNDAEWANYSAQVKAQIDRFDVDIAALQTSTLDLSTTTRAQYDAAIEDLEKKQMNARQEYEELKHATAQTWMNVKSRLDISLQGLTEAYADLKLRIDANFQENERP